MRPILILRGSKGKNAVPTVYRSIHPSHLGKLDINSSGTSDPGMTGIICPMIKTNGLYFDPNFKEPENWPDDYENMKKEFESINSTEEVKNLNKILGLEYDINDEGLISFRKIDPTINKVQDTLNEKMVSLESEVVKGLVEDEYRQVMKANEDGGLDALEYQLGDEDEEYLDVIKIETFNDEE